MLGRVNVIGGFLRCDGDCSGMVECCSMASVLIFLYTGFWNFGVAFLRINGVNGFFEEVVECFGNGDNGRVYRRWSVISSRRKYEQ